MLDVWMLFTLLFAFAEILVQSVMETNKQELIDLGHGSAQKSNQISTIPYEPEVEQNSTGNHHHHRHRIGSKDSPKLKYVTLLTIILSC